MVKKRVKIAKKNNLKSKNKDQIDVWSTPCLVCESLDRCGVGQQISPISCSNINHWILQRGIPIQKEDSP